MLCLPRTTLKLLQAFVVMSALVGCTAAPESKPDMMMGAKGKPMCSMCMDKMDSGEMSCCSCCQGMMKDMKGMSPEQKKMMKQCMKTHKDMMGDKSGMMDSNKMSTPSDQPTPVDDNSHAQHHPAGSN